MQYLGIDWGTRKQGWCGVDERGVLVEGMVPADEDGLAWLMQRLGPDVRGCGLRVPCLEFRATLGRVVASRRRARDRP
jgi:hypothetical protein